MSVFFLLTNKLYVFILRPWWVRRNTGSAGIQNQVHWRWIPSFIFWNCKHILSSLVNTLAFLKELCSSYVIYEDLVHAKISLSKWLHNLKLVLCLTILIVKIFHYMTILCYSFILYLVHSAIYFRNNFSWFSDVLWSLSNVSNSYSRSFLWLLTNPCMFFFA